VATTTTPGNHIPNPLAPTLPLPLPPTPYPLPPPLTPTPYPYPSPSGCTLSKEKPTIVLGADVYHAPPDSDRASFAALVGSMDQGLGAYYSTVAAQQARRTASSSSSSSTSSTGGTASTGSTGSTVAGGCRCGCRRAVLHTLRALGRGCAMAAGAQEVRAPALTLPLTLSSRARRSS
jgi:hypothetical protein